MESTNLRLHVDTQFTSAYAMSAFVALREKRLSFEMTTIEFASSARTRPAFAG